MKKLTKMLAVLLSLSMLTGVGVRAEEEAVETQTATYDFSDFTTGGTAPTGFTIQNQTHFCTPAVVDNAYGTSVSMKGNLEILYEIPDSYAAGTVMHLGFDLYMADDSGPNVWDFALSADTIWNTIFYVDNGGVLKIGEAEAAIKTNAWNNIDVRITTRGAGENANCILYVNGVWTGQYNTGTDGNISKLIFKTWGAENLVYVDNFRFDAPNTITPFKAELKSEYLYEGDTKAVINFNDTINAGAFWGAIKAGSVVVTETNLLTGDTTNPEVIFETECKKAIVNFNAPLKGDCRYEIAIPEAVVNMTGEVCQPRTLSFETRALVDFYDDFESYTEKGQWLKKDTENGTGWVKWDSASNAWTGCAGYEPDENPIYGKQAFWDAAQKLEYTFPYAMNSGKFIVSFDMRLPEDKSGNLIYLDFINGTTNAMFMRWWNYGLTTAGWSAGSEGKTITHNGGAWGHYDFVFDFDTGVVNVYFDNVLWHSEAITAVTGLRIYRNACGFAIDNFHARHPQKNIVITSLTGEVTAGTNTAYVAFRDAVNPEAITESSFQVVNEDMDFLDITIKNKNWYGAEIEFEEALTAGLYEFAISGLSGIRGEALSQEAFSFTVADEAVAKEYKVNTLSLIDGQGAALADVAAWNKDIAYTVKADVVNTLGTKEGFVAIVAGFNGTTLTAIRFATFEDIENSGEYTASVEAFDMNGATSIKLFALDSLQGIKPVMADVAQIPAV